MEVICNEDGVPVRIRMLKPTDMHQHLRDGAILRLVAPMVAKRFRSAIIMPNLVPPITTCDQVTEYVALIRKATNGSMWPFMTLYLTDMLEPYEVRSALESHSAVIGIKYYPPGLTTNSDGGVKNPSSLWTPGTRPYLCLRALAAYDGVFLIHAADGITPAPWNGPSRNYGKGEELDPYEQEMHFLEQTLPRIMDAHPNLKISVEHLSTADGADQIRHWGQDRPGKVGCSLTAHHLLLDRRDVFRRGFNPHRSWMPVIQSFEHTQELRKLASEDLPFVWLGSDSAPHPRSKKESDCCASGVLMAHAGIELYAEAFGDMNALDDRFERFASINGRTFFDIDGFYGLHPSSETIELVREEWKVEQPFVCLDESPGSIRWAGNQRVPPSRDEQVVPFRLGETISWKLV